MTRQIRVITAGVMLGVMALLAACSHSDSAGVAACASPVKYNHKVYYGTKNVKFKAIRQVGNAKTVPCDDGDESAKDRQHTLPAYAVEGIDPGIAIGVGSTPKAAILMTIKVKGKLPREVRNLIDRN